MSFPAIVVSTHLLMVEDYVHHVAQILFFELIFNNLLYINLYDRNVMLCTVFSKTKFKYNKNKPIMKNLVLTVTSGRPNALDAI